MKFTRMENGEWLKHRFPEELRVSKASETLLVDLPVGTTLTISTPCPPHDLSDVVRETFGDFRRCNDCSVRVYEREQK